MLAVADVMPSNFLPVGLLYYCRASMTSDDTATGVPSMYRRRDISSVATRLHARAAGISTGRRFLLRRQRTPPSLKRVGRVTPHGGGTSARARRRERRRVMLAARCYISCYFIGARRSRRFRSLMPLLRMPYATGVEPARARAFCERGEVMAGLFQFFSRNRRGHRMLPLSCRFLALL